MLTISSNLIMDVCFYFFSEKVTGTNQMISLALSAVRLFLSLLTATVTIWWVLVFVSLFRGKNQDPFHRFHQANPVHLPPPPLSPTPPPPPDLTAFLNVVFYFTFPYVGVVEQLKLIFLCVMSSNLYKTLFASC